MQNKLHELSTNLAVTVETTTNLAVIRAVTVRERERERGVKISWDLSGRCKSERERRGVKISRDLSGRCGKMAAHGTTPGTGNNIKYSPGRDSWPTANPIVAALCPTSERMGKEAGDKKLQRVRLSSRRKREALGNVS